MNADENSKSEPATSPKAPPAIQLPAVIWILLAFLWAVQAVLSIAGQSLEMWATYLFAFIPARVTVADFPQPPGAALWTFLTYAMLHADWFHLLSNTIWLAIFSKPVEMRLGPWRYLALLGLSVVGGSFAFLLNHWTESTAVVGISGGVSGVLAAAIPLMHGRFDSLLDRSGRRFAPLTPVQLLSSPQALTFGAVFLVLNLLTAASEAQSVQAFLPQGQIAWEAHIGGFITGLIMFYVLDATRPRKPVHTLH
jgi:membrane associated rhomboid family serine protease